MHATTVSSTGEKIFRVSLFRRGLSLFGTGFVGLISIGFACVTVFAWQGGPGVFAVFILLTLFMVGLTQYTARDLTGRWGLRFAFGPDSVTADLPKGRSAIHRLPREHVVIPYSEIAAIETRLEAYRSFGMAMMQQPYVLRWKSGAMNFLFEDRALGSGMADIEFGDVVAELQARSGAPLNDLGMVEGRGGILGVWGTGAMPWSTPSLSSSGQARLWRRVAMTGWLAAGAFLLAMLIRFLAMAG